MNPASSGLSNDDDGKVKLARSHFFSGDIVPAGLVADTIERSWKRCLNGGLDAAARPVFSLLTPKQLKETKERNRLLTEVAHPELENLYQQIINTRSVVMLTDAQAVILNSVGSVDATDRRVWVAGNPGVCWAEERMGTNAIGTAVVEQKPLSVYGKEHFVEDNGIFSCTASPIFDPFGVLIGVLDVSGGNQVRQAHIQTLVGMSAQLIENRLFLARFQECLTIRFHSRPEFLGTLWEGIAIFSGDGSLVAANRGALLQFEIQRDKLHRYDLSSLVDVSLENILDYFSVPGRSPLLAYLRNGVRVYLNARVGSGDGLHKQSTSYLPTLEVACSRKGVDAKSASMRLADIAFDDPGVEAMIEKARRAFAADIPVLLEGETGTGKEVLAKALHCDSARRSGPFVAINCASIPESLIEAELFGYKEGAFTGAKRGGSRGKIQQAQKGTLFLDEIGDMPVELQARLLRVLQEREVTPLGGEKVIPVDVAVICATNCNLKELVSKGRFREDLYYRLNGLRITLPPLRKRENIRDIVTRIVNVKADGRPVQVGEDAMEIFLSHPWPGNLRQLCNVISTALALLGNDRRIEPHHLTDDFMKELLDTGAGENDASEPPAKAARGILEDLEAQAIRNALERHSGNITAAALALGISRGTLYRKIKQYRNPPKGC